LPPKPRSKYTILIIIGIIIVLFAAALLIYFLNRQKTSVDEPTSNNTTTTNNTFSDYRNSKVGFSTQIPANLKPDQSDDPSRVSFTEEGSGSGGGPAEGGQQISSYTFASIWYENSTQTPQEAIVDEKSTVQKFPIKDFKVISEENITIDGQPGVKAVWSYSDLQTNAAVISANAYAAKAGKMWKINYLIGGPSVEEILKTWNETSYIFEKMISAFRFL